MQVLECCQTAPAAAANKELLHLCGGCAQHLVMYASCAMRAPATCLWLGAGALGLTRHSMLIPLVTQLGSIGTDIFAAYPG